MYNRRSNVKEDTSHVSRYSLINRQSERDRRCLRKLEELSQSVRRTSFNNNKVKRRYILSVSPSVLKVWVKYTDYGNEQSSIESKEDYFICPDIPLINRQSKRDRRCLRKLEVLSQSVWRTSFNNNVVKERIYFR